MRTLASYSSQVCHSKKSHGNKHHITKLAVHSAGSPHLLKFWMNHAENNMVVMVNRFPIKKWLNSVFMHNEVLLKNYIFSSLQYPTMKGKKKHYKNGCTFQVLLPFPKHFYPFYPLSLFRLLDSAVLSFVSSLWGPSTEECKQGGLGRPVIGTIIGLQMWGVSLSGNRVSLVMTSLLSPQSASVAASGTLKIKSMSVSETSLPALLFSGALPSYKIFGNNFIIKYSLKTLNQIKYQINIIWTSICLITHPCIMQWLF